MTQSEDRTTYNIEKYRGNAGTVRFKFNFDDLIFQWKHHFIFRVERKSMDLPFKMLNSFIGVTLELSDGPTQDRSPQ